ncbi:THAP domain-containing protein 7 isoform X1 [Misgurnus anguillicaudatus]|uniref:THAP domain-containing protein 7 isoform X1 n=2 Tax=Misgurnus anguillicaudatus TaxID=75329 RepID=UPI003CCFB290
MSDMHFNSSIGKHDQIKCEISHMPRHCSAVGCKSRDTKGLRKSGITFHRLPKKGNPRRTTWIINSCRKGPEGKGQWDPQSGFIYFCSKHFTPDSFELSGVSGYRRLKDDAIPTVFDIQPHERCNAKKGTTKRRGRPRNVDKHISVEDSNNECSESQEISNSERKMQNVAEDEGVKSFEQDKGDENQEEPSSKAAPVEDQPPEASSPQPSPRPPSPSCYMRRLPPPPGFYLAKEHNYAQLCPLVWRKRYDKAIDSLEKTMLLLSATRRRENRLRSALMRLRENRLRSTLSRVRDGMKGKEVRGGRFSSRAVKKAQATKGERAGSLEALEENLNEGAADDISLLTDGWNSQSQARSKVMVEDEEGCCFYCGRGSEGNKVFGYKEATVEPNDVQGLPIKCRPKEVPNVLKNQCLENTRTDVPPVEQQSYYLYYCESTENEDTMQVVTMELQPHQLNAEDETSLDLQDDGETIQQLAVLHSQTETHPQMHTVPVQYSTTLHDTSAPFQLQVLQPHQGLFLPELETKDKSESENDQGGGQQFYWVQERTNDHENGQVIHQSNLRTTVVAGDVRERLKEHLEVFQLQLSNEFID